MQSFFKVMVWFWMHLRITVWYIEYKYCVFTVTLELFAVWLRYSKFIQAVVYWKRPKLGGYDGVTVNSCHLNNSYSGERKVTASYATTSQSFNGSSHMLLVQKHIALNAVSCETKSSHPTVNLNVTDWKRHSLSFLQVWGGISELANKAHTAN